jgi:hypothetical protein
VTVFAYKNIKVALLILLSLLVTTSEIFFLQTEIAHGLIFSSLFYAWLNYDAATLSKLKTFFHQFVGVVIFGRCCGFLLCVNLSFNSVNKYATYMDIAKDITAIM